MAGPRVATLVEVQQGKQFRLLFIWLQCFYQLAGGTNSYTIDSLKKAGLFQSTTFPGNSGTETSEMTSSKKALIGGIAYGGYARKIVGRALRKIPLQFGRVRIEDHPDYLMEALQEAMSLVGPVKNPPFSGL